MQTVKSRNKGAPKKDRGWWHDFFPAFRPLFDTFPTSTTRAEVNYTKAKLGLKPGSKFLDCPCGIGRISIPLAKRGVKVTGVDITASYLDELAEKSRRNGLKIVTVKCDMRRIDFDSEFDAAGNLWTSFGYFEKETDNQAVLKRIFRALKPGGRFLLHVINRDWIMKNYTPSSLYDAGDCLVFEERKFDYSRSINVSTWRFFADGKLKAYRCDLRLYSYHELLAMMKKAGFIDIVGYGSMKDEPISRNSQMMFILGTKPK